MANRTMIRNFIRKMSISSSYKGNKKYTNSLAEIKKRISKSNLLKDLDGEELDNWNKRIDLVLASADNQKIKCIPTAGTLQNDLLVMHNGIVIEPLSYYGYPILKMLLNNKGIHEPQEEYVFQEVLREMPRGATMIELGAYWAFYSMWFNKEVRDAKNYMIEPENITSGINNFKLNGLQGNFFQYYVSDKLGIHHNGIKDISVDNFIQDNNIDFVDILHSDIQGYELSMLNGAYDLLTKNKIGYIFISTHSNELHSNCMKLLDNIGFTQVCSANLEETYSVDGLLVYKNPRYQGISKLNISLRGKNE